MSPSHEPAAPRRLEIPVLSDIRGNVWAAGVVDVTLRHQGRCVLFESPPFGLSEDQARTLLASGAELARARGEAGAVTVAFEADLATGETRLLETAAGLPAAHAVVEALTGVDLPAWQARLARGGSLDADLPQPRGHAFQVCLSARDPEHGFAPIIGVVDTLRLPAGPGLRADAAVAEGDVPDPAEPDIVRLTAHGRNRTEALLRLQQGLAGTVAVVQGGGTDKAFLTELLDQSEIDRGGADAAWLDELIERGAHLSRRGIEAALLGAALSIYERETDAARGLFYASALRGRPQVPPDTGVTAGLGYRGQAYTLHVACLEPGLYRIQGDGIGLEVKAGPPGRTGRRLTCGGRGWHVSAVLQGDDFLIEVDGVPHRISAGDPTVSGHGEGSPEGDRVRFDSLMQRSSPAEGLEEVRRLVLGYDVDPMGAQRSAESAGAETAGASRLEEDILRAVVDLAWLFRQHPEAGGRFSPEETLFAFLRDLDAGSATLPAPFADRLRRALSYYGVAGLDHTPGLEESLFRIVLSHHRRHEQTAALLALLDRLLARGSAGAEIHDLLDRLVEETQRGEPVVHDLAREVRYRLFDQPLLVAAGRKLLDGVESDLAVLAGACPPAEREERIRAIVDCPQPIHAFLSQRYTESSSTPLRAAVLEILVRRYYERVRGLHDVAVTARPAGPSFATAEYEHPRARVRLLAFHAEGPGVTEALDEAVRILGEIAADPSDGREPALDLYVWRPGELQEEAVAGEIAARLARPDFPPGLRRVAVCVARPERVHCFTFRPAAGGGYEEDGLTRGLHPMIAQRFELWRLTAFQLERLAAPDGVLLFRGVAHENPRDERLFALAEVRDLTPVRDADGRAVELPQLERMLMEALAGIRRFQARRPPRERLHWNRVLLYLWPPVDLRPAELEGLVHRLAPRTGGLGMEKIVIRCRIPDRDSGALLDWVLEISNPASGMTVRFRRLSEAPLKPLREYSQKVVELRKRGLVHPFDIVHMLGDFAEHDLDEDGGLAPVSRPPGQSSASLVVGVVRSITARYPEGMARVILVSDPGRDLGALGEPECRRIVAAIDLAERMQAPLEWFPFSAGPQPDGAAPDWAGRVLRRLVEHTKNGGEVNLVVAGINAGFQPFWNAAATMLTDARGLLVMTPDGSMVLAGRKDLSSLASEENQAMGGYERILGPNGQAQCFAKDLPEACRLLLRWYEHTFRAPGERFPRPAPTTDPRDRDVRDHPHGGLFRTVGEIFSDDTNPGRGKPFDIRKVLGAVIDQDHEPLERWFGMRDAEIGVVWDAHLGGHPVCLLGFESRPLARLGSAQAHSPDHWTAGTLSPLSAKKIARAIQTASGNRPLVILASLAGFDGSPESMRHWQLEYAAGIARALVTFQGPIALCLLAHQDDGAALIFSAALNDRIEIAALEGATAPGSAHPVLPVERLRPWLIEAVERGISRT